MLVDFMKKLLILLLIVSMFVFVVALDEPSTGIGGEDVENIQGAIDNYTPLDESGEVNFSKYKPLKSKAEERMDAIDLWLKDNAPWLSLVFGMVPEFSFYFMVNLYLWLWGTVVLIFNSRRNLYLRFFSMKGGAKNTPLYIGILVFILFFIVMKVNILFTNFYWISWEWGSGTWWGTLIRIVSLIASTVALAYSFGLWGKYRQKKVKEDAKKNEALNREVLEKTVEGITD